MALVVEGDKYILRGPKGKLFKDYFEFVSNIKA